jgi:ATP-binding cassette subfamily F protein 3
MLQLKDAQKRFGSRTLLDGASFSITDVQKIALIGANGSGKSTLCRILIGDEELERGEIIRHRDLRTGYLRQHDPFREGESAWDFLQRDTGRPDWRCAEVAGKFEIKGPILEGPVQELSGGWQTRIKLAALLLHDPNFLVLDEPTNFLDLRTQLLLERFLHGFRGACLMVSHDRTFLGKTCTETLELSQGRLTQFAGDVDSYLEHKEKLRRHDEKVNRTIATKAKQLQRFIDKHRARPGTASQARSKAKQLERLRAGEIEIDAAESRARIRVPGVTARKGTALACEDLAVGYPDLTVASGIELDVEHGKRVVVVGDNGQGKTTFLRTIAGTLPPREGRFGWGFGCDVGYYSQLVYTDLPEDRTVMQYLTERTAPGTPTQAVRDLAGGFLFRGDEVEKSIEVLSGGERARLCLAGLLLGGHNILVLDEPGNHLDVDSVETLAKALLDYQGTVLFTSHDRHFMERVATDVLEVRDGRIAKYLGGYRAYLDGVRREIEEGVREAVRPGKPVRKKEKPGPREKARARERFELRKKAANLERKIGRLEKQRKKVNAAYLKATDPGESKKLHDELWALREELARLEETWLGMLEELGE